MRTYSQQTEMERRLGKDECGPTYIGANVIHFKRFGWVYSTRNTSTQFVLYSV